LGGKMYWVVALNPMTFIIEGIKVSTLGVGVLTPLTFLYSVITTTLIIAAGFLIFNKVEKNFVDTI
jgi:lipopolysaccharide transport system permease protein